MAAYGLVQLEKLAEFNQRRWRNFQVLDQAIAAYDDLDRAAVQEPLLERNIPTRMIWSDNICANPVRRDPVPGTRRWLRQRGPAHGSRAVPAPPPAA